MTDEEDSAGICLRGQVRRELFALGFVIGEADFDQAVVGEGLIESGEDGFGDPIVADVDDGFEFLGAGFEFAEGWFVHVRKRKRE